MMFSIGDIIWSWWPLIEDMDAIAETNERMMRHEEMQKKRKDIQDRLVFRLLFR